MFQCRPSPLQLRFVENDFCETFVKKMPYRDQSSTKVVVRRRRWAEELPAALLPIAVTVVSPLALLLPVMRELRVLLQCAEQTESAVHEQQLAVRRLLEIGLLRRLRALLAPHLLRLRRLQVRASQCWRRVCLRMVAVHRFVEQ